MWNYCQNSYYIVFDLKDYVEFILCRKTPSTLKKHNLTYFICVEDVIPTYDL